MSEKRDYEATVEVEFIYDAATVDPFYWVDPDDGDRKWRLAGIYSQVTTEDEMWRHLAYNALFNGVYDASSLDGWGDLPKGALTMRLSEHFIEEAS